MSTWSVKTEEQPLHGLAKFSEETFEHFLIGGDSRYITRRQETTSTKIDEGFWMQAQLKFAVQFEKIKFMASLGNLENPRVSQDVKWQSPEYYVMLTPQEQVYFRAGRFEPVYGLRLPDHNLLIKSELGLVDRGHSAVARG